MEQLQLALVGAVLLIIPPLTMLVIAKLRNMKADLDSAFAKIRAHEQEMGIKTTQDKNGVQHVSRDPSKIVGGQAAPGANGEGDGQGKSA